MSLPEDDAGITIIELVVTLTIIAVGIFSTMQVFLASLGVSASADSRTRASAIAGREVEGMRAAPYERVGFSETSPGFVATVTDEGTTYSTVVVASPAMTPIGEDEVIDGVHFTIRRDVVWIAFGTASSAFKRVGAAVTWTDGGGQHVVRQDAAVYPGGLGPYGGTASTTTTLPVQVAPSMPVGLVGLPDPVSGMDAVALTWTPGPVLPAWWEVQYSSTGGSSWVTATTTQPAGTTDFALSGLSAGTAYLFRVRGVTGALASQWAQAALVTESAAVPCAVVSASVTPTSVQKKNGNALEQDLTVTANTSGSCASLMVEFPATAVFQAPMVQSGSTFTRSEDKNAHSWSAGPKIIRILSPSGIELATVSLVVLA